MERRRQHDLCDKLVSSQRVVHGEYASVLGKSSLSRTSDFAVRSSLINFVSPVVSRARPSPKVTKAIVYNCLPLSPELVPCASSQLKTCQMHDYSLIFHGKLLTSRTPGNPQESPGIRPKEASPIPQNPPEILKNNGNLKNQQNIEKQRQDIKQTKQTH